MAIVITSPVNANLADNFSSLVVTYTKIRTYADIAIKVNSVIVAEITGVTGDSVTFSNSSTLRNAIWAAARGSSLVGCISIFAVEYNAGYINVLNATLSGGTLSINYRNSALNTTYPNSSSPLNLDAADPQNLIASWTRPHAAFLARLKFYVFNGTSYVSIFNRYGFGASTPSTSLDIKNIGGTDYTSAMIAAMNGVSPRACELELFTQFDDGAYKDVGTLNDSDIMANSIIKSFITLSTIAISNFDLLPIDMSIPFTLTTYGSYPHTVKLYLKKADGTAVLIKTQSVSAGVVSGNFAIGSAERSIILNALPTVTYATTYAEVTTDTYGTTNSTGIATTLSLNADFKPALGTITWVEFMTYVKTALGYGAGTPLFLTSKSRVTFTVPITNAIGATTVTVRVQFAGTDKLQATSPITTDFLITSGSLQATITVTDSRSRSTSVTTAAIVIRAYVYPKVDKFEVFRSDLVLGAYAPLGTYLRCIAKGTASTIKALDGTTEKNWVKYKIDYRIKATGSYSNNVAVVPGGLVFGELTTNGIAGFLVTNAYDVRIRVFDAFYDLDGDGSALEDTDDYAESITILPFGEVSMMLGRKSMSIGKVWTQGALDVAGDVYVNGGKVWHSGNDGSGSGLDADTLRGYAPSLLNFGNTLPVRDANGYITSEWYNSSRGYETSAAAGYIYDTGDGYMRKKSLANAKAELLATPTFTGQVNVSNVRKIISIGLSIPANDVAWKDVGAFVYVPIYTACIVELKIGGIQQGVGTFGVYKKWHISRENGVITCNLIVNDYWGATNQTSQIIHSLTAEHVYIYVKSANISGCVYLGTFEVNGSFGG